ncbi:E3 ubiquitin-protein ligase AIP2 [Rhodamnia argentea]|uniref:RING-type E3 ubiquitin transferase n=1 Tax=Rhodamnia argentea TaxID=178133 RepID=A0A8B8PUT2_9MYRT|nr:E3 ubiquitin-protein ligase AIP2 [Rhodamnia argentea]
MESEGGLELRLQELQKQLGKKQEFEEAVSSIKSVLQRCYPSASPPLRRSIYSVVCRVATILKTRHTAPGFWLAGLGLFEEAESLVSNASEKEHLKSCIAQAREQLHIVDNPTPESTQSNASRGYLFEGHLTVDPEPPRPHWLVQSELMNTVSMLAAAESSQQMEDNHMSETAANLFQELMDNIDTTLPEILDNIPVAPRAPPASKEVVAKLPVITLSEEILAKMGHDAECAICRENLVVNDEMQELPCKHTYHPPCLKPWLDEHNSCPICRHELQTDDHTYESWKELEKEAEEERKGAANAVRGGEYMYV